MQKFLLLFSFFVTVSLLHAQPSSENWVPITLEKDHSLFINVTGLSSFTGDDFFVWSLEEMDSPITMEEVDGNIYKVKTYYHINKEMKRYSIIQIIYYDRENNVLKQYSYQHNLDKPEFIFNSPIFHNSYIEKILLKSSEYLKPSEKG
jgi:hypothetical protein